MEDVRPASLQEKLPTIPSAAADAACWCKTFPSLGGSFLVGVDRGNNGYPNSGTFLLHHLEPETWVISLMRSCYLSTVQLRTPHLFLQEKFRSPRDAQQRILWFKALFWVWKIKEIQIFNPPTTTTTTTTTARFSLLLVKSAMPWNISPHHNTNPTDHPKNMAFS